MRPNNTLRFITLSAFTSLLLVTTACSKNESAQEKKTDATELSDNTHAALNKAKDAAKAVEDRTLSMEEKLEKMAMAAPDMSEVFADGDKYMDWFSKRPNVQKTASGLLYRVTEQGTGAKPVRENTVNVHYRGTFPNGEEFDSSYKNGKPIQFGVTGVIAGWTEMLLLMNEGSKVEVVIPSELAYGERGAGRGLIPPNQVLKFDIELLDADFKK